VTRPALRFIGVRTLENQAALMHHKAREMLVAQRTQLINALRGHLAEIGVVAAQGLKNARGLAGIITAESDETVPACVRMALAPPVRQLHALDQEIALGAADILPDILPDIYCLPDPRPEDAR